MLLASILLRGCHILCAITWFGSAIYRVMVQIPSVVGLPSANQRALGRRLHEKQELLLIVAALLVILLGMLLGTVVGPLQTPDMFLLDYGITWLAALGTTVAVLVWEVFVVSTAQSHFFDDDTVWQTTSAAYGVQRVRQWRHIARLAWIEMVGFGIILLCMVLMHYGY